MTHTITHLLTSIFMFAGGPITRFEVILFSGIAGGVILVGICWQLVDHWIERTRGRKWPTTSAVIDIVSVTFIPDSPQMRTTLGGYYLAQLTYTYQDPELQTGDYSRRFAYEDEARAWANSYKGETVRIHVDPRDPTRSVLRKEDL
jgi:hypothetical protein